MEEAGTPNLGRGLLSALGLGVELETGDLAARGNLATLDADGRVADRRAGPIDDERARAIVDHLGSEVALPEAKIQAIEGVDALIPELLALGPDVLAVTGDHAAATQLSAHSGHPVPTLLWGEAVGRDAVE